MCVENFTILETQNKNIKNTNVDTYHTHAKLCYAIVYTVKYKYFFLCEWVCAKKSKRMHLCLL